MKILNKVIYNILNYTRSKETLDFVNNITHINNYDLIIPNLYLGNINASNDEDFFKKCNVCAIVNCTENEPFHLYFHDKPKLRLYVNDSKEKSNIEKFKKEIINAIDFIEECIENKITVFVHCYWGLMRSATVIAAYLIKTYKINHIDAIKLIREQRQFAIASFYNFNEILLFVEKVYI